MNRRPIATTVTGSHPGFRSLLLAASLLAASSAHAIVDDVPYFNLYPGAPAPGSDVSVSLCGESTCSSSLEMTVSVVTDNNTGAGSGNRDTFLRLQNPNANVTTETAYNTDSTTLQNDGSYTNGAKDTTAGNNDDFNNAVLLSDLRVENGKYQILLDINEPGGNKKLIRLDEFEIHLSTNGILEQYRPVESDSTPPGTDAGASFFADASWTRLVYDMDFDRYGADDAVGGGNGNANADGYGGLILDSTAGSNGSGDEDYLFELPTGLFTAAEVNGGLYLHLVSTFGEADAMAEGAAQSGFEEWAAVLGDNPVGEPDIPVPAPATALLVALGALGLIRRKRG